MPDMYTETCCGTSGKEKRVNAMARAARRGMYRTGDRIDDAKGRGSAWGDKKPDPVAIADARTSMCDYRCARVNALGVPADRNGFAL